MSKEAILRNDEQAGVLDSTTTSVEQPSAQAEDAHSVSIRVQKYLEKFQERRVEVSVEPSGTKGKRGPKSVVVSKALPDFSLEPTRHLLV